MPDRGDKGVCGEPGCDEEGDHIISCEECGGLIGYLCDDHVEKLERRLLRGGAENMRRAQERNN